MEWIGPLLELAQTGSPYVAGGAIVALAASILIREIRRHYVAELATWNERYAELFARYEKLEAKNDEHLRAWLDSEREKAEIIRRGREVAREVGGS